MDRKIGRPDVSRGYPERHGENWHDFCIIHDASRFGEGLFLFDPFEQGRLHAGLFFSNVNESVFLLPVGSLIPSRFPMFQITTGDLRIVPDDENVFTV